VVIPTYGGRSPDLLRRTLESLEHEILPASLDKIIVAENGPKSGAESLCQEHHARLPLVYLYSDVAGASHARNLGASHATSDLIIFFDDDIRLSGNTLEAYSAAFREHGLGHFYGGPVRIDFEVAPDPTLLEFLPDSVRGFSLPMSEPGPADVSARFLGANHAVPKNALVGISGFDAHGAAGVNNGGIGEETRLQDRLLQFGINGLYVPNAIVWHHVPSNACDFQWLKQRYTRYGVTEATLEAARRSSVRAILGVPMWLLRAIAEAVMRQLWLALSGAPRSAQIANSLNTYRLLGQIRGYFTAGAKAVRGQRSCD